ncbi:MULTISPECIES: hypothetical protein [Kitasatospora]|uniref:Uncharacterized protein n=2 Tax=Kitasatospora TaxID=2063 RepID=A0ABT1J628_9ACTN|nr:hypothetical protein [Kitasatospora paracochleata]MCP2312891.1 hypothetical protein [Kitasatospora paracochleata]
MIHNDVARRTAPSLPARSLQPRVTACDSPVISADPTVRPLVRALPLRALGRTETDGS